MAQAEYFAAVYAIIRDSSWKYLFQRRANTGFNDWILQFPSWHIEWEETYFQALKREMKEEINIDFWEQDVELKHVIHRICKWNRVYFDVFFEIQRYTWDIKNMEEEKCSELDFFNILHPDITFYNKEVIGHIKNWVQLSEIIM